MALWLAQPEHQALLQIAGAPCELFPLCHHPSPIKHGVLKVQHLHLWDKTAQGGAEGLEELCCSPEPGMAQCGRVQRDRDGPKLLSVCSALSYVHLSPSPAACWTRAFGIAKRARAKMCPGFGGEHLEGLSCRNSRASQSS